MGSSFIKYRDRGFWSHDAFIELFLARLAEEMASLPPADWVRAAADHWRSQASGVFAGWVHPQFDDHLAGEDRRAAILGLVAAIRVRPDAALELTQTCDLVERLLKGELLTDASSPLDYMVQPAPESRHT